MVNKKGWIRIVEASVGILLVLGVLLVLFTQNNQVEKRDLSADLSPLIEEIANNLSLREDIVKLNLTNPDNVNSIRLKINEFLATRITNPNMAYNVSICALSDSVCPLNITPYPTSIDNQIYTKERVISPYSEDYLPKKVKIFV